MENNLNTNNKFWRYITNFWTFVVYIVAIGDYITNNGWHDYLGPVATIYVAILAIYAGEKEFERWYDYYKGRHPGEVFIFIWTILIIGLITTNFFLNKPYVLPGEIITVYITVLGILAITNKSKKIFKEKHNKQHTLKGK
ncbi:hypothetical protein COV23_01000 [Candidatus Wolfebacteria bacterium CG10_big_fil_rev_8_21_14_0_10_31_9]|uniref:Uncharacterized protein n=1 Tax=Candidatus Wolfebacteria bacterium CG10_big_fil_rev_8_21_14_0_10_31_9 TaxID=1975070 RepID=A0A2H0RCM4_9BACT|nr:MAG: hypothetical protein COV23_01000 [Candidatus Wolfebacteria bacterium CG10_big_fil_rev_8_21_14_0_10_31_9]